MSPVPGFTLQWRSVQAPAAAAPAPVVKSATPAVPLPPSSGAPVESERPYGRPLPEDAAAAPAESLLSSAPEEMEADAQQAMRSAATLTEDASAINDESAEAIPTHHG